MTFCSKLTKIVELNDYGGNFERYEEYLYNIFLDDLYNMKIFYSGIPVSLRRNPTFNDKEYSFYHLTCKDFDHTGDEDQRDPDLRRCERIHWIKPTIETDHETECNQDCIYVYNKTVRNKDRIHFLNEKDRYMVVLEKRDEYYLLVTAYYIEYDNTLKRKIKEYEKTLK